MTPDPIRIYLVDDHPLVREWLANLLQRSENFCVCGQADSAPAGLAAMLAAPPDVAIVDLSLQGGSGLDLIRDLNAHLPGTRIVVLSMHEELFYVERAFRAGARGYVTKSESTRHIMEAVREVAAGRIYANKPILAGLAERAASGGAAQSIECLSNRELDVFKRLGQGHPTRRIAEDLHVSIKTVQAYCARIKDKLGVRDGTELVRHAIRWVDHSSTAS
jgi:DNA-binding NarL/FixJ family response regulator